MELLPAMDQKTAQKILNQIKASYNIIADDFNKTRSYLWPGLQGFKKYVKDGDRILDLGCGNGKLRLLFKDVNPSTSSGQGFKIDYIGVDSSEALIKIAEARKDFEIENQKFLVADAQNLPFSDNFFDVVFLIGVLHHLPGNKLRLKTLLETKRILKPGGYLIMTNWSGGNKKFWRPLFYYTSLKIFGKSELDFGDVFLPWMGGQISRYYHIFTLTGLKRLIKKSGLNLEQNYLISWLGKKIKGRNYLKAANLVTIAKK